MRQYLKGEKITAVGSDAMGVGFARDRTGYVYARVGPGGYLCYLPGPLPAELGETSGPERYLRNAFVDDVWAERRDRIIRVRLVRRNRSGSSTYGQLVCELIRPRVQIVLISEESNAVLGKWVREGRRGVGRARVVVGKAYVPPPLQDRILPGEDPFSSFSSRLKPNDKVGPSLGRILVGIDNGILPEILHRLGLNAHETTAQIPSLRWTRIWRAVRELYDALPQPQGYVWQEGCRKFFSALEPTHKGEARKRCSSISEALILVENEDRMLEKKRRQKQRLEKGLTVALRRMEKRIDALRQDLKEAGRAEELERMGSILMAHLSSVKQGFSQVELPDIFDLSGRSRVVIDLDRRRSPAENGKWYLKTSRKLQRRRQVLPNFLQKLETEAGNIRRLLLELEEGKDLDHGEIEGRLREHGVAGQEERKQARRDPLAHPRRYCTATGWSVWAGRNNKENDQLTHRMASKDDIWLHAHGYAGSHVILRRQGRREEPGSQTLKEAAGVAAYWSKGRTSNKVAVVYTLVKYVFKPRGSTPGTASIRRGKTLLVEPALLPEERDGTRKAR